MKTLVDHLAQYAAYHRDPRNIATHFVGVPMIVLAVATLLARPALEVGGVPISLALLAALGTGLFYFRLDLRFGLAMAPVLAAVVLIGEWFSAQGTTPWLLAGGGLFVVGWIIQFIGHHYEGKKPAFVDDVVGLLVGPLFLAAEAAFAMHLRPEVQAAVEARVGKIRPRETASA